MKEAGLRAKIKRKFGVNTADSNHKLPVAENVLDRNFEPKGPGEVLTSDITYIPTGEGCFILLSRLTLEPIRQRAGAWMRL